MVSLYTRKCAVTKTKQTKGSWDGNKEEQTGHVRKIRPLFFAVPAVPLSAGLPHPHMSSGGEFAISDLHAELENGDETSDRDPASSEGAVRNENKID